MAKSVGRKVSARSAGIRQIPVSEVKIMVGEVEYSTFVTELVDMNAAVVCGYTGNNFVGTPIYGHLRSKQAQMGSYVNIGKNHFYPKAEIRKTIQSYFDFLARKTATQTQTPEVAELLRKLAQNPELAKALLELVA